MTSKSSEGPGGLGTGLQVTYDSKQKNFKQNHVSAQESGVRPAATRQIPLRAAGAPGDTGGHGADPVASRYGERRYREGYDEGFFEVLLWLELGSDFLCRVSDSVEAWRVAIDSELLPVPGDEWDEPPAVALCQAEYDQRLARGAI